MTMNEPLTRERLLGHFATLAEHHRRTLFERLVEAGLASPAGFDIRDWSHVTTQVEVALTGIRRTLERWTPRPPVTDPQEQEQLLTILDEVIGERIGDILDEWTTLLTTAAGRSEKRLNAWNHERLVTQDQQTQRAARALLNEPPQEDFDHMERIAHPDGRFSFRYHIKPAPERD